MVSALEVPAADLIRELSDRLKKIESIKPPAWAAHVKTGAHRERKPQQPDWWYARTASILRKTYITGRIGVGRLRTLYGGRKSRGSIPEKHVRAGGGVIRKIMKQLEEAELVKKAEPGRILTPKGRSFVDKAVTDLKKKGVKVERTGEAGAEGKRRKGETKTTAAKETARAGRPGKAGKAKPREPRAGEQG